VHLSRNEILFMIDPCGSELPPNETVPSHTDTKGRIQKHLLCYIDDKYVPYSFLQIYGECLLLRRYTVWLL
jgi:hypothetical protein